MRPGPLCFAIFIGSMLFPVQADEYRFDFGQELASEEPTFIFPSLDGQLCFYDSCVPAENKRQKVCRFSLDFCVVRVENFNGRQMPAGFDLYLWGRAITEDDRRSLQTRPEFVELAVYPVEGNAEAKLFGLVLPADIPAALAVLPPEDFFREVAIADMTTDRRGTAVCNWGMSSSASPSTRRCIVTKLVVDGREYVRAKIGSQYFWDLRRPDMRPGSAGFYGETDLSLVASDTTQPNSFLEAIEQRLFVEKLQADPDAIERDDLTESWTRVFATGRRLSIVDPQLNEDTEIIFTLSYLGKTEFIAMHGEPPPPSRAEYRIAWRVYSFVSRVNSADPSAWTMPTAIFSENYRSLISNTVEVVTREFNGAAGRVN